MVTEFYCQTHQPTAAACGLEIHKLIVNQLERNVVLELLPLFIFHDILFCETLLHFRIVFNHGLPPFQQQTSDPCPKSYTLNHHTPRNYSKSPLIPAPKPKVQLHRFQERKAHRSSCVFTAQLVQYCPHCPEYSWRIIKRNIQMFI